MSLLFNMLSRLIITFLTKIKCLLISWLYSPSAVILEPLKIKSLTELFQILKDDAVKVLHSKCQQIWKTQQCPQDWKRSIFIPVPKRGNAKQCSNYCTVALISHARKVMLKIPQARLQWYMDCELPDVQAGFRKGRGTKIKLPTSVGSMEKYESSRKTFTSALLTKPKPLTVWVTTNSGKFFKRWEYQSTWPVSW